MKRRTFLTRAGLSATGAGVWTAVPRLAAAQAPAEAPPAEPPLLLVTAAHLPWVASLTAAVADRFRLRFTSGVDFPMAKGIAANLKEPEAAAPLVEGVQAIVHLPASAESAAAAEQIDDVTRGVYHLLTAAVAAGVQRVVYLSSLEMLASYPPHLMVDESFRPVPGEAAEPLARWLGEFTCREFARAGLLEVIVLRAGACEAAGIACTRKALPRTQAEDLARAVAAALAYSFPPIRQKAIRWEVLHVHSEPGNRRFPLTRAGRMLRFEPRSGGRMP